MTTGRIRRVSRAGRIIGRHGVALALVLAFPLAIECLAETIRPTRLTRLTRPTALTRLIRPTIAEAQEPVKVRLMGDPQKGKEAPAFSLPYFTSEGPGPADQPFTLRAELGRVVVLAFCRGLTDSTAVVLLRTLTARYDSLFPGEVAVAALLPETGAALAAAARDNTLRIKLLPDSTESIRRLYGVERNGTSVYVIGPTGRVLWRELRFNPLLATGYDRIRQEVVAGGQPGGSR